ncbi:MAG TPA: hypothetical protein VJK29_14760 [Terriglobales bacterium]|nr:hypothetical protein [Terriglobales bacterium]
MATSAGVVGSSLYQTVAGLQHGFLRAEPAVGLGHAPETLGAVVGFHAVGALEPFERFVVVAAAEVQLGLLQRLVESVVALRGGAPAGWSTSQAGQPGRQRNDEPRQCKRRHAHS